MTATVTVSHIELVGKSRAHHACDRIGTFDRRRVLLKPFAVIIALLDILIRLIDFVAKSKFTYAFLMDLSYAVASFLFVKEKSLK